MHGLNDLVVAGKVICLGISDTLAWVVAKANQYSRDDGLRQSVVYQGLWNASIRDFEREIIPLCRDEGMELLPYGTLGQGRFQTEAAFKEQEKNNEGRKMKPVGELDRTVSKILEKIANAKGATITSVALAYTVHKAPYVFPIVGGRKVEHLKGNIAAFGISLSEDDIKEIEKVYVFDHGFPHTFLSGTIFSGETPEAAKGPGDVWLTKLFGNFDWVQAEKPIGPVQS
jgi:aryl-alcohol dehydrogenase-like predicted oxidoreductase